MLTKITDLEDIKGKTIKDTENNIYGMALTFTDNTYAIFIPTTNEDIELESRNTDFYLEQFTILKPSPKMDSNAVFNRYHKRLNRIDFMQKSKEISERYTTRKELFADAIQTGETLLSIEEIVNPTYKDAISEMVSELKAAYDKLSVEGQIEGDLAILSNQCYIIATHLFYYLEG